MSQYTGHLEKRHKSTWQIVIEGKRTDGKRKRIYRSFKGNKKDAEETMRRLLTELETGKYIEPTKLSVDEYLKMWLKDYGKSNLADSTYESYERIMIKHVIPGLGADTLLCELQPIQIQKYCTKKLETLSRRTVQYHYRIIREALQHAIHWKLLAFNPANNCKSPKVSSPEVVVPDLKTIDRLIDADTPDHPLIVTALFTGMRRGELLGLRWSDINWETGNISVIQQVQDNGKGVVFKDSPKGNAKSRRSVTAPKFLLTILKSHKAEQNEIRLMQGESYLDNGLIFCRLDGSPERPSNLSHRFKNLVDKLGITMRLHDCRHFHATLLLSWDVDGRKVQDRLGWSTGAMLQAYQHVTQNMQKEIANMLDKKYGRRLGDGTQKNSDPDSRQKTL